MRFHKLVSTCLGIGYINNGKGAGTIAAIVASVAWYLAWAGGFPPLYLSLSITIAITLLGVWSSDVVAKVWGEDPAKVVIDEVAGMWISLLFLPVCWQYTLAGLILFRIFDIVKPLYIRKMENLRGGWGIMFDDVLAGVYANILLQTALFFKLF
ncbi:MAG TPA: phosphatidylglycerophosphatase A [Mucilaginibacter sp.]|jgi:phosphatidylglycerophosphatase A|nr:phosphatidylglycerophosphatase A [Mucilaginibacter sp.]